MDLEEKLHNLPEKIGVYIFRDDLGRVLYIGKATNLKSRVMQYFQSASISETPRRAQLRSFIFDLDYILVNSPSEALILEANLIKRYRPRFNVRMKDDKRYPCIEITVYENFPRMRIIRRPENKKSRYFGPYTSANAMRRTFKLIQKVFKVRTCKYDLNKPLDRPCLDYHINLCPAPCVKYISQQDYMKKSFQACNFLDGHPGEILNNLKEELEKSSENLQFERCATLRDLIESIEHVTTRRPVVTAISEDADFISCAIEKDMAVISVMQVRDGILLGNLHFNMETAGTEPGELLDRFIQQFYIPGFFIPPVIYVPVLPENAEAIEAFLLKVRSRKVKLKVPKRGEHREILQLTMNNATEQLKVQRKVSMERRDKNREALENLRQILKLSEIPSRIEGFDISNISGKLSSASMVVFMDGEPFKEHYRRFKIRGGDTPDDFSMINEAVSRRLKNLKMGELDSFRERPDLILIDGGKGQLRAALEASGSAGMEFLKIIALAKNQEQIFIPGVQDPLPADPDSPGVKLLRRVRDEAHRFALSHHRKMRKEKIEISILDGIPGISKRRKETLLKHFDSIDDIAAASLYDLSELPGFNRKVAESVLKYLGTAK